MELNLGIATKSKSSCSLLLKPIVKIIYKKNLRSQGTIFGCPQTNSFLFYTRYSNINSYFIHKMGSFMPFQTKMFVVVLQFDISAKGFRSARIKKSSVSELF
jgi:hypothetical protein